MLDPVSPTMRSQPQAAQARLTLPSRLRGLGKTAQVTAECHGVSGARRSYPGSTRIQSSQGGLPGGGVPCLVETGRDVSFVSVKPPSQTQSCKGHSLTSAPLCPQEPRLTSAPLCPQEPHLTSAPLCPQACNCDQYLKVSKEMMKQLVWLGSQREVPSSTGVCAPRGWPRAPWGSVDSGPTTGTPRTKVHVWPGTGEGQHMTS